MAVYGEHRYMKLKYLQEDKAIDGNLLRTLAFKNPLLQILGAGGSNPSGRAIKSMTLGTGRAGRTAAG